MAWRSSLQEIHVGGWDLPKRIGGQGVSCANMMKVFENVGSISIDLRDVPGAGHARLISLLRRRMFDDFLKDVIAGSAYCAVAITEEAAGSDLLSIETIASPIGDSYVISGTKSFVSRLSEASHAIVFCQVARSGLVRRLTAFLVDLASPGITIEPLRPMGITGTSWGRLTLSSVNTSISARIGGEGEGFQLFRRHFSYWRAAMASAALGACESTLELLREHLVSRMAYGQPLGRLTHLQQEIAKHLYAVFVNRLLIGKVAAAMDSGEDPYVLAAMAKAEILEFAVALHVWAQQTLGARAYQEQHPVAKRLRDLAGLAIADGTTPTLRAQVSRGFLGDDLYDLGLGRTPGLLQRSVTTKTRFW